MVRGLFEGAQYNSEAGAKCADYSRARTKQGRGVIEEIRYLEYHFSMLRTALFCDERSWSIRNAAKQHSKCSIAGKGGGGC